MENRYFVEYDTPSALWCVFDDTGHAYASFMAEDEALAYAIQMNS